MLQEAVDAYIAVLSTKEDERTSTNANTVLAYRNDIKQLCSYLQTLQIEHWSQVTRDQLTDYLKTMREEHAYRPTTIARKLAAFKSFFRYLTKVSHVEVNPTETLEAPPIPKERPQVLTLEQITNLFNQVDKGTIVGQRDIAMLQVLSVTGMRASEIVSLQVDDFQQEQAKIRCPGRNNLAYRELPLPPFVVETMIQYLTNARPRLLRHSEERGLFLNHHGERLTRQGFWLIIKGYARQVGISEITPHMLRHSFAMLMLQSGMELRSIQELLGHTHISSVQMYSHMAHTTPRT